ncbi:MAG: pyridoxal phosphate-dependent aminotransferase [Alphaproteobacteria bacterium]|jgi:aspartate aminotransferase
MSLIAKRLSNIKPSPTLSLSAKANELKTKGIDVLNMTVGEPDFDTPINIKDAANKAIAQGKTKYTAVDGIIELKEAICKKFKRENNLDFTTSQITVGNGGKQVIYNCMMATLNPGDEVIVPAPYWVSYPEIVTISEGVPVIVSCREDVAFKLTPKILENAITDKTKWLILNSPSNPTGGLYSMDELQQLAKVLRNYPQVNILSDDIYEHITYDQKFYTIAEVAPDIIDRVFTVNGVSKSYAMTGWRIGYGAGIESLIKAIAIIQSQSTTNPCSISQYAALEAINGPQDFIKTNRESFKHRRDLVVSMLRVVEGIKCDIPGGAFYLFANCQSFIGKKTPKGDMINNDNDFCGYLLTDALVALVPGSAFGLDGFFRISYATSEAVIKEAMIRIKKACDSLS